MTYLLQEETTVKGCQHLRSKRHRRLCPFVRLAVCRCFSVLFRCWKQAIRKSGIRCKHCANACVDGLQIINVGHVRQWVLIELRHGLSVLHLLSCCNVVESGNSWQTQETMEYFHVFLQPIFCTTLRFHSLYLTLAYQKTKTIAFRSAR